mgnify:FL=1
MKGRFRWLVGSAVAAVLLLVPALGTAAAADPTPVPGGPGGFRGPEGAAGVAGRGAGHGFASVFEALQKLTGLTAEEIVAQRHAGKSAVEIAREKNVGEDALMAEVLAARKAALDEAVKAGRITQERADFMLKNMTERVKEGLNRTSVGPRGGQGWPAWAGQAQRGPGKPSEGRGPGLANRWGSQGRAQ